jgi:hypothetical protein
MDEDLLEQGKNSLLDESDSVSEITEKTVRKEVFTEVITVAEEEKRTGNSINVGSAEELVARANLSYISSMANINRAFNKLSSKGKTRVLLSILSLPMGGLPVKLRGAEEVYCYGVGQRIQQDRFIILQHSINQEMKRLRIAEEERKKNLDKESELDDNNKKENKK